MTIVTNKSEVNSKLLNFSVTYFEITNTLNTNRKREPIFSV